MIELSKQAAELYRGALVWDNVWPVDLKGGVSVGNHWGELSRFAQAGVGVIGITLAGDNQNVSEAMGLLGWARRHIRENDHQLVLIEKIGDVFAARANDKLGVTLQFEGTRCFERNLDLIDVYYALGVRQSILAFNNSNSVGGGCAEEVDNGLSKFGKRFVDEMQRVGMLVDLSHVGHRTSLDALERSTKPMLFTHSNVYALHASFRNIHDDQIRACAASGGLIGVSGASAYLGDDIGRTETLFRHIDYLVQMVGADHVGLGLDVVFDHEALNAYVRGRPDEWPIAADPQWAGFKYAMPEQLLELTSTMMNQGYASEAILQILGGNYVRICGQVWRP